MMNITERFLKYVGYCTTSDETTGLTPSTPGQMEFAQVLRISFGEVGFLSRVGGDEFIVALEEVSEGEVREHIASMLEKLDLLDRREKNINHSVAYGYAFRTEVEDRMSATVQKLADARMYEMKSSQKKQAQRDAMMRLTTEA